MLPKRMAARADAVRRTRRTRLNGGCPAEADAGRGGEAGDEPHRTQASTDQASTDTATTEKAAEPAEAEPVAAEQGDGA